MLILMLLSRAVKRKISFVLLETEKVTNGSGADVVQIHSFPCLYHFNLVGRSTLDL